jgi:hypothetical protein
MAEVGIAKEQGGSSTPFTESGAESTVMYQLIKPSG